MNVMKYLPTFSVAIRGIFANKLRSFLTVLGVAIGIGAIISMNAVGVGSEKAITADFTKIGSNLFQVLPGAGYMGLLTGAEGSAKTLTYDDALAIAESPEITSVKMVIPQSGARMQLITDEGNINAQVNGTTPIYAQGLNKILASGEFFTDYDIENRTMVCVLGGKLATDLFGDKDPMGERVRAENRSFTVIGVFQRDGEMMWSTSDNAMYIPITTDMYRLNPRYSTKGEHLVSSIAMEAVSESEVDDAIDQVTSLLRERHRLSPGDRNDFTLYNQQEYLDMMTNTNDTLKRLLRNTAILALFIAGIGIMNIMLVSVTERTREIGIRKAVGAKRRHIMSQFLLEAATISVIGGVIGIGLGFLAAEYAFTDYEVNQIGLQQVPIDPIVTLDIVLISFGVAVAVGIVFGLYPAWRASRLNPIQALRYE